MGATNHSANPPDDMEDPDSADREIESPEPPVIYRSHSRYNGWSCPPHPYQFIAWGCYIYLGVFYFTTVVPGLLKEWQPAGYIVVAVFFIIHLIVHILACSVNPADPSVLRKMKKGQNKVSRFDRGTHKHVIEDQHCYLCEVDVGASSKHCSSCNKCVADFDHHCRWLNNCVGGRNYRLFLGTLVSSLAGLLLIFILCLLQFIAYFTDKGKGNILKWYYDVYHDSQDAQNGGSMVSDSGLMNNTVTSSVSVTSSLPPAEPQFQVFYIDAPSGVWLGMIAFTAVLCILGLALLIHLFSFHVYLMCKGLSTYDYIVAERQKAEEKARQEELDPEYKTKARKPNKVAPQVNSDEVGGSTCRSNTARSYDYAKSEYGAPPSSRSAGLASVTQRSDHAHYEHEYPGEEEGGVNPSARSTLSATTPTVTPTSAPNLSSPYSPYDTSSDRRPPSGFPVNHSGNNRREHIKIQHSLDGITHGNHHHNRPRHAESQLAVSGSRKKMRRKRRKLHSGLYGSSNMPTFDDTQDLVSAIEGQRLSPNLDSDSGVGPSSMSDVGVEVVAAAKQKNSATDSCPQSFSKPSTTLGNQLQSDSDSDAFDTGVQPESPSSNERRRLPPRVPVERLALPLSSESDSERNTKQNGISSLYMGQSPSVYHHSNHIHAASPARAYNSDSAESLHEIPLSKTVVGGHNSFPGHRHLPPAVPNGLKEANSLPRARRKKRKPRTEAQEASMEMQSYPVPDRPRRHKEVPPLDLSSLNSDEDDSPRKTKHKQAASQI